MMSQESYICWTVEKRAKRMPEITVQITPTLQKKLQDWPKTIEVGLQEKRYMREDRVGT